MKRHELDGARGVLLDGLIVWLEGAAVYALLLLSMSAASVSAKDEEVQTVVDPAIGLQAQGPSQAGRRRHRVVEALPQLHRDCADIREQYELKRSQTSLEASCHCCLVSVQYIASRTMASNVRTGICRPQGALSSLREQRLVRFAT